MSLRFEVFTDSQGLPRIVDHQTSAQAPFMTPAIAQSVADDLNAYPDLVDHVGWLLPGDTGVQS